MEILAGGRLRQEINVSARLLDEQGSIRPRYILDDRLGPIFVEYDPDFSNDYGERVLAKLIALWRIRSFVLSAMLPKGVGVFSFYWGPEGSSIGVSNGRLGAECRIAWSGRGVPTKARDSVSDLRRIFASRIEDAVEKFALFDEERRMLEDALAKHRRSSSGSEPLMLRSNRYNTLAAVYPAA